MSRSWRSEEVRIDINPTPWSAAAWRRFSPRWAGGAMSAEAFMMTTDVAPPRSASTPWSAAAWRRFGPRRPGAAMSAEAFKQERLRPLTVRPKRRLAGALQGVESVAAFV